MEYQEHCKGCVFLRFEFDKDGFPNIPLCHAENVSKEEQMKKVQRKECLQCEEGHRLKKERKELEEKGEKIPVTEEYKYDKVGYSKEPVGYCGSALQGIDKPCYDGEGKYCYSRTGCTGQMSLKDPTRRSSCQSNRDFSECMSKVLGDNIERINMGEFIIENLTEEEERILNENEIDWIIDDIFSNTRDITIYCNKRDIYRILKLIGREK